MISFLLLAVLVSPVAEKTCGQVICPFTRTGRVCICVPPVISLGWWDPVPLDYEFKEPSYSEPYAWPHYPAEFHLPEPIKSSPIWEVP